MSGRRVLLTGGAGFVGANLARRLLAEGDDLHLLLRPGCDRWRIVDLAGAVAVHEIALEDREGLARVVRDVRPEWTFHLAVHGAYPGQVDLWRMVDTNIAGTIALAEACRAFGCEVLVNTGSSSEYGFMDHAPGEHELAVPNSAYAFTKAAATLFCGFAARHWEMRVPTLRLYSVYGPWEEPSRLIPTLLGALLDGRLPALAGPRTARDFVFVDDVCDAYLLAAADRSQPADAVYNVGTGLQTSLAELIDLATKLVPVGVAPSWGSMARRDWDTTTWVADPNRLRSALGWEPRWSLGDGLAATIRWLREDADRAAGYERRRQDGQRRS